MVHTTKEKQSTGTARQPGLLSGKEPGSTASAFLAVGSLDEVRTKYTGETGVVQGYGGSSANLSQHQLNKDMIAQLGAINSGDSIVDLGSGAGATTNYFGKTGASRVVGVDPGAKAIQIAQQKASELGAKVEYRQGHAQTALKPRSGHARRINSQPSPARAAHQFTKMHGGFMMSELVTSPCLYTGAQRSRLASSS